MKLLAAMISLGIVVEKTTPLGGGMGLMGLVIPVSLMGAVVVMAVAHSSSSGAGNRLATAGDVEEGGCMAASGVIVVPGGQAVGVMNAQE